MIPLYIELEGSKGIKAGLRVESIIVDLRQLVPDDAKLVALRGDNGAGKSTLMNLGMVPWREPPHLPVDIYNEFGPKGRRVLIWQHGGATYKSELEIRQSAKTKSQKAYLYELKRDGDFSSQNEGDGQQWAAVEFEDGLTADGKGRTYDQCLERILGPRDLYYLAAFRAQGTAKLAEHDDPKALMEDLLDLEQITAAVGKTKLVVREINREIAQWRERAGTATAIRRVIGEVQQQIKEEEAKLPALKLTARAAEDAVSSARIALEEAKRGDQDIEKVRLARSAAETALKEAEDNLEAVQSSCDTSMQTLSARLSAQKIDARNAVTSAHGRVVNAERVVSDLRASINGEDLVKRAEQRVVELEAETAALETERADNQAKLEEARELERELATESTALKQLRTDGAKASADVTEFERRHQFVSVVPCNGEGEFASCPALADAIEAGKQIPEAKTKYQGCVSSWKLQHAKVQGLEAKQVDRGELLREKARIERDRTDKLESLRKERLAAGERAAIDQAKAMLEGAREDVERLRAEEEQAELKEKTVLDQARADTEDQESANQNYSAKAMEKVTAARGVLTRTPIPEENEILSAAQLTLDEAQAALEEADNEGKRVSGLIEGKRGRLQAKEEELEHMGEVEAYVQKLQDEVAAYKLLDFALRGTIDLTIEDAGPTIAATANRLLDGSYGGRFQVEIKTQNERPDGTLVECFDIEVYDTETGDRSSIVHKSGGEGVWLDKALTDSVGLYHQLTSGKSYETLFGDECEDGLTQERKSAYYRMMRETMTEGNYHRMIFISHSPEAWAVADAVIDMREL